MDIAKRLIDYGFHPYTTAFPLIVPGAMMIEPTESESRQECDLFVDAMRSIAEEAATTPRSSRPPRIPPRSPAWTRWAPPQTRPALEAQVEQAFSLLLLNREIKKSRVTIQSFAL